MNSELGQVKRQSTGGAVGCLFFCFRLALVPVFALGFRGKPLKLFASHEASFPAPVSTSIIQQTLDFVKRLLYNRKQKRGNATMTMQKRINMALAYAGMSQAEAARRIGMTPSNFNQKYKRETFTEEEQRQIAKVLGCKYQSRFIFPDGTEIGE